MTPHRVLVVDDNNINVALASYILQRKGFEVTSACDACSAIESAAVFRPDVVLMDIQMPEVDGLEALRRLRSNAIGKDLVIIAFTAYAMKGDEQKMLAAGFDGYIAKPIDIATFGETVQAHIRR